MADILSPEEIEALLTSLASDEAAEAGDAQLVEETPTAQRPRRGGESATTYPTRPARPPGSAEPYDFRRPDKLSKDQLRTLQMLHESCGRLASGTLAGYLRTPVQVELISIEQLPYEEYLRSIDQSIFAIFSLPPLHGQAVLELEFGLVFSMIDRMLGGPGRLIARTALTEIERPLALQLIDGFLGAIKSAWETVVAVNPTIESLETSAQFVQIAPPNDIAVTVLFEVKVANQRGAVSLCIPYLVLKPITQKLSAQKWVATAGRRRSEEDRGYLSQQITRTSLNCKVELGTANVTIGEFLRLRKGDVIPLDQQRGREARLHVVNSPKFLGHPALRGSRLVFTVTERIRA